MYQHTDRLYQPPLPTTYWPHPNHKLTTYMYQYYTDHLYWPHANHKTTTYQSHTNNIPTPYQQHTDHLYWPHTNQINLFTITVPFANVNTIIKFRALYFYWLPSTLMNDNLHIMSGTYVFKQLPAFFKLTQKHKKEPHNIQHQDSQQRGHRHVSSILDRLPVTSFNIVSLGSAHHRCIRAQEWHAPLLHLITVEDYSPGKTENECSQQHKLMTSLFSQEWRASTVHCQTNFLSWACSFTIVKSQLIHKWSM